MNAEQLNKLKELAQKATPGPWYADTPIPGKPRFTVADCFSSKVYMQDQRPSHGTTGLDDALFIAAANPAAVLELIAKVQTPLHEHNARFAIDGAMWKGHENVDPPPTEDHWLMPYWKIARELAEFKAAAERTTSPVSQMTDEQIEKHISSVQAPESTVAIDEIVACFEGEECEEVFESIKAYGEIYARRALLALAAAAPHAQAPAAPVTHNPHTGTLRDSRDIASDPEAILCVKPGQPLHAAQPQPVADPEGIDVEFVNLMSAYRHAESAEAHQKARRALVDYHRAAIAASQQAAEPAATKWAIYYDNLGEQPYTSAWMAEWHLYNSEEEARAQIAHFTFGKHYIPKKVEVYLADARPATQQPQDERAAFQAWQMALPEDDPIRTFYEDRDATAWQAWQARAALAKKGGAE